MNGATGTATRAACQPVTPMQDYRIDGWLIQPALNRLVRGGTTIRVRPQLIDVLGCLAARPGAVVSKAQLLAIVWSDRFVAASGVARCVAELRQALADDARQPRIIETIAKRGYRLIARVEPVGSVGAEPARPVPASAPLPRPPAATDDRAPSSDRAVTPGRAWWGHLVTTARSLLMGGVVSALVRHGPRDFLR